MMVIVIKKEVLQTRLPRRPRKRRRLRKRLKKLCLRFIIALVAPLKIQLATEYAPSVTLLVHLWNKLLRNSALPLWPFSKLQKRQVKKTQTRALQPRKRP
jgi:hypothetical protein